MKVSLNWLKDYVQIKDSAQKAAERLTMAGLEVKKLEEVSEDTILETEITTNRPDWLSHLGVAREIHAVTGARFSVPPFRAKITGGCERVIQVSIPDRDLCPYYSASLLEGVEGGETPDFMKRRLETCGVRSINLIVDITNYVLLEWGQPLHAFDADRLHGNEILARRAHAGEKITAIDGTIYELRTDDLVIADSKGPVAIAGVMGGRDSEVNTETKNILLESAFFTPSSIRTTARRLGLSSESSYRFERRVDPRGVDLARERAIYLMAQHAGLKRVSPVFYSGKPPIQEPKISLAQSEIKKVLGIDIPQAKTKSFLKRLGLRVSGSKKRFSVQVPSFRCDLRQPADLIEEVARLYSYEQIAETLPETGPLASRVDPILDLEERVRDLCVSFGFQEAITFSLVDSTPFGELGFPKSQWVRLINPQNKELNLMRPNLLSGLMLALRRNLYMSRTNVWLFEVGNRYLEQSEDKLPQEERMLALLLSGEGGLEWLEKKRAASFYDLKGVIEELFPRLGVGSVSMETMADSIFRSGEGISLTCGGEAIGFYGTLSDRVRRVYDIEKPVFYAELSLEKIARLVKKDLSTEEIPKFPSSPRDLSLIVREDVKAETILAKIRQMASGLASKIEVFDYFKGGKIPKGKKSLSFRIFYQAKDRTLQNEEVNQLHFSIVDSLSQSLGAELPKARADAIIK